MSRRIAVVAALLLAAAPAAAPALGSTTGPRIVGGTPAPDGSWPSIVYVETDLHNGYAEQCGGTVIAPDWVATAAHCMVSRDAPYPTHTPADVSVVAGRHDLTDNSAGEVLTVGEIFVHDGYDRVEGADGGNDVALLHLANATTAPPMLVANGVDAPSYVSPNGTPNIAGWGVTSENGTSSDQLLQAYVPLLPDDQCRAGGADPDSRFNASTMLCAGGTGTDTCQGDSGGPLIEFTPAGAPVLWGITSWGTGCGTHQGYYVRVTAYTAFFQRAVPGLPLPPPPPPPAPPPPQPQPQPQPSAPVAAADVTAPVLSAIRVSGPVRLKGHRPRRAIVVSLRSSEAGTAVITLLHRDARGRLTAVHGAYRVAVVAGANRITLPRSVWSLRRGAYRLQVQVRDAAGNAATARGALSVRR
jgi:Trypsin